MQAAKLSTLYMFYSQKDIVSLTNFLEICSQISQINGPKEEQPRVEMGPPWLNKVESESESKY